MTKIVNKKIIWDKILLGIAIMCVFFLLFFFYMDGRSGILC